MNNSIWPKDVGIRAIEIYFPSWCVEQSELEQYDGVSAGKYTIGLGQARLGFCGDCEDINSICLTVTKRLLEQTGISPSMIGHLDVGTETIIDKSKSVKTVLMQLFGDANDLEGVDSTNACYGGTAALLNAVSWMESSEWDGRLALVVSGDIAVYEKGPARPTGGVGAIAMLIGPNAPVVLDRGVRASHMTHTYDFYKPILDSEYPIVFGQLSVECYIDTLQKCYDKFCKKWGKRHKTDEMMSMDNFDAMLFHSPYCKLVKKAFARLVLYDFFRDPSNPKYQSIAHLKSRTLSDTFLDREIETIMMNFAKDSFDKKVNDNLLLSTEIGNMYTVSLYGCLVSYLISKPLDELVNNRIGVFAYGGGLTGTFFTMRTTQYAYALEPLLRSLANVKKLLNDRKRIAPSVYSDIMLNREKNHNKAPYKPVDAIDDLFPGTYYLTKVDDMYRRTYQRVPPEPRM